MHFNSALSLGSFVKGYRTENIAATSLVFSSGNFALAMVSFHALGPQIPTLIVRDESDLGANHFLTRK